MAFTYVAVDGARLHYLLGDRCGPDTWLGSGKKELSEVG